MKQLQEEIIVLFHAALIGRTDVVQNAISSIRASGKMTDQEIAATISTGRSEDSATPLHIAAHYGHKDVIRSLLNAGADLSFAPAIGEYAECRPYELANDATKEIFHVYMFEQIAMNNYEAICRLMEGGVPVDTKDDSPVGDSTLHWAASFGSVKVASVLITYGCSVNIKNEIGQTPLHLACKGKHLELITLLLDEGGDLEVTDQEGHKPSELPVGGTTKEIENLLSHPPVPSLKLCSMYEKKKEEKAAREQLLHQQRILQKQLAEAALHTTTPDIDNHDDNNANDDESLPSQEQHGHDHSQQHSTHHEEDIHSTEKDLLIFWPPVKRQQQYPNVSPLVLRNNRNLLICVASSDIDMIPLLTWSGLMDVMDGFGFQVQIKRSSTGARVRLCIDRNICPVHNSYELKVNSEQIFLTAGDSAGLLYGVYTLIQLLKLHSNGQVDDHGGVLSLTVPCLAITDRPDVAQRGVLWSYRQQSRSASSRMMEQIELMSRLRFNTLYLIIDPVSEQPVHTITTTTAATTIPTNNHKIDANQTEMTSTKVYALDEKCRRHCVDLIPTLVIQSVHQRLPLDVLKNFSHKMISLVIVFDQHSVAEELKSGSSKSIEDNIDITAEVCAACITACELVIKDAHLAGCTTISLSCSEWTRHTADPVSIAINAGLSATERDFSISFPSSLFSKPLFCVQDYIQNINIYSSKVEAHCSALSVFPAFMDRDFMYPALLIKYFCFMFGGFAWNRMSLLDMLGDPAGLEFNANIVREAMYLLMFPAKVEVPQTAFQTMMDLVTGSAFAAELKTMQGVGGGAFGPGNALVAVNGNTSRTDKTSTGLERSASDASISGTGCTEAVPLRAELGVSHVLRQDLVKAEKLLWALLTAQDGMSTTAVPTKSEAAVCLRVYKRVLQLANWKPDSLANKQTTKSGLLSFIAVGASANFSGDIDENALERAGVDTTQSIVFEVEELFCTLNMLAALCKAVVLAHKAHEKNHSVGSSGSGTHLPGGGLTVMSCEALFDPVSVGTKSDFANSVLECLSSCAFLWRRRFEGSLLASFKAANLLLLKPIQEHSPHHHTASSSSHSRSTWLIAHTIREANRQYLLQHIPIIPAAAIFRLVTKNIPLPKSVHEFIQRLFTR